MNAQVLRLGLVASGMAISISCNTMVASMFALAPASVILIGIVVAGAIMAVVALCYAELFSRYPGSLGIRAFSRAALGDRASLAFSLLYVVLAVAMGGFEGQLCYRVCRAWLAPLPALASVVAVFGTVVWVNVKGLSAPSILQSSCTVLVFLMLVAMGAWYSRGLDVDGLVAELSGASLRSLSAVPTALFLFVGIEWACFDVADTKAFRRDLPRALQLAVVVVAMAYLPLTVALYNRFPADQIARLDLPHLALAADNPWALNATIVTSLLALITSFNVGLGGAARILYALAREGMLPKYFVRVSVPALVPTRAVWFTALSVSVVAACFANPRLFVLAPQVLAVDVCVIYLTTLCCWLRSRGPSRVGIGVQLRIPVVAVALAGALIAAIVIQLVVVEMNLLAQSILLGQAAVIGGCAVRRARAGALAPVLGA